MTRFHCSYKWDDGSKRATIAVDGRKIVDNLRYTSSIFHITEVIRIHSTSYDSRNAFAANCSYIIDDIKIGK